VYTFTVNRLRTALAGAVAVVTLANDCVAGGEVCYPRLPCFDRKPSSLERDNSVTRHVAVQWPPYDFNRQQYMVIGELR